jgi:2-polyprenyl-3-methyl-5-hydroxy-6-metoxy-1,4-benzoquinol methylase
MSSNLKKKIPSKQYQLKECRICGSSQLYSFLDLGYMPIPNGFIDKKDLNKLEMNYPLRVCVCENCWLMQLEHVIPAEIMFKNYLYIPSTSKTMLKHFKQMSEETMKVAGARKGNLVIDIGSNDGALLGDYKKSGMDILGIDPAENIVRDANKRGIRTIAAYFSEKTANEVAEKYGNAKIITATNVIAHINNLHDVVKGIKVLLDKEGVFVMEAPYVIDLLDNNEFDTIYHEHLSYFSIRPLRQLFEMYDMKIVDVRKQFIHGGSVRVYAAHKSSRYAIHPRVDKFITEENLKKLHLRNTYNEFSRRVKVIKRDVISFLKRIKKEGRSVIGYGASAKGNVFTNYCNITTELLDYVVDSTPYKHGKYTPGTHLPIFPESKLDKATPDYALLLSWNFADEIIEKQQKYRERGGQFIVTIPYLKII